MKPRKPKGRRVWVLVTDYGSIRGVFCDEKPTPAPGYCVVPATLTLHEKGKKRNG